MVQKVILLLGMIMLLSSMSYAADSKENWQTMELHTKTPDQLVAQAYPPPYRGSREYEYESHIENHHVIYGPGFF
jgi:hypothetical protein